MMKRIVSINLWLTVIIFSSPGYSQVDLNKTAQTTMNFLLVGTSARASALGDAFTALGTGVESMYYNPAGLSELAKSFDINVNYTGWIADINYISGGIAYNLGNYGVVGINLLTVDYGQINGTSLIPPDQQDLYPDGYIDNGVVSNVAAYSIGLAYAKAITEEFAVGGNIKLAGQNLGESLISSQTKQNDATKILFDAGVRYKTEFYGFVFGMSIRNFASNLKREEIDEQLPLLFSLGASIDVMQIIMQESKSNNELLLTGDFLHPNNYTERVNLGIEYKFLQMFSLRAGYQTNRDLASWSGGIGLFTSIADYDIEVNYSYSSFELFDSVSRLSLLFAL